MTHKIFLKKNGYNVTVTDNFRKGLNIFFSDPEKYDLIITDYYIGDKTGIDLAREITKIKPDIPVILCTGDYTNFMNEKAIEAGIRDVLLKPYDYKTFMEKIGNFFNENN
jgi:DNA-binding NtrC family response regulator